MTHLEKELDGLMAKQSENESSEDDLSDGEALRTADVLGVERPRNNSTIEEEIRADILPENKSSTNKESKAKLSEEEITEVEKPEEKTTLDWKEMIKEEELLTEKIPKTEMPEKSKIIQKERNELLKGKVSQEKESEIREKNKSPHLNFKSTCDM